MTTTIITLRPDGLQPERARKLAEPVLAAKNTDYDLVHGVEEFINSIEVLFAPGTPDYVGALDATRIDVNGQKVWSCHYGDGVGDGPDWTANATWFEQEIPGLMHALGVDLWVSADIYGLSPAHTVP